MTREEMIDDLVRIRLYAMEDDSRAELLKWIEETMYAEYKDLDEKSLKLELNCYREGAFTECKMCAGKGYYNLSSSYDDIHSRVPCECGQYNEE